MPQSIAPELDQLEAALTAAESALKAKDTEIADLKGQVLDPTEAARLTTLVQRAAALLGSPSTAPPAA
jgi:hypothetical protein